MCFVLKISSYQSTPKNNNPHSKRAVMDRTRMMHQQNHFQNYTLLLILLNAIFIEIKPRGEEIAMLILRLRGGHHIVLRGCYLRVPLRSQNWDFSTPCGKNYATSTKKQLQQ